MDRNDLIIGIIITLVVLIFTFIFFDRIIHFGATESHKEICKREVELNALSTSLQSAINCPPINFTITTEPNSKQTMKKIADLMADTREIYDSGWKRQDLFSAQSGTFCAVYATVDFKNKNSNFDSGQLINYMTTTTYNPVKGQTYADFFFGREDRMLSARLQMDLRTQNPAPTSEKYAVIFKYKKQYPFKQEKLNNIGAYLTSGGGTELAPAQAAVASRLMVAGAGVIVGAGATAFVAMTGGVGGVWLAGLTAAGGVTGGVGAGAWALWKDETIVTSSEVFFTQYHNETSLYDIGCQYFPVSLGTRPGSPAEVK